MMGTPGLTLGLSAETTEDAAPAALQEISIKGRSISIKTTKPAAYNVFKISNPDRLVIELSHTQNKWKRKEIILKNNALFRRVRAAQFTTNPLVARVVLELKKPVDYESKTDGNLITLSASATGEPAQAEAPNAAEPAAESMAAAPTPAEAVETASNVQEPSPYMDTTQPQEPTPTSEPETPLKNEMTAVPEVPAPEIKAEAPKAVSAVVPAPSAPKPTEPAPEPKKATMAPAPKVELAALSSEPTSLFGRQLVTLDFYDIDIRELFKLLGEKSGVNIVYGNTVSGSVSIQLRDVTFKDAVETVLALTDLRLIAMGKNIVQIMTPLEFDKYRTSAISTTRVFPINYAKVGDVNSQLTSILGTLGGKGKTMIDERTNSLIVTDTPEGIEKTAQLIMDLDKPAPQVMIEAKIVQVSLGKSLDLGITWGAAYTDQSGNQMISIGASKAQPAPDPSPGSMGSAGLQTQTALNPSGGSGLELGGAGFSPGQGLGLTFGFVKDVVRLNAALSALAQKNKSKLLSNPKIATLNNQSATIKSEVSEPYLTTQTQLTNAGTLSTQVVNTTKSGISLTVTPTINADGRITIKIVPDITSSQPTAIGVPKTTSQTANTTVSVKDGETFVIGGLINEQESDQKAYIPVLGSIPLIGHFFKKTGLSKSRAELLVFVTPKIIPY